MSTSSQPLLICTFETCTSRMQELASRQHWTDLLRWTDRTFALIRTLPGETAGMRATAYYYQWIALDGLRRKDEAYAAYVKYSELLNPTKQP